MTKRQLLEQLQSVPDDEPLFLMVQGSEGDVTIYSTDSAGYYEVDDNPGEDIARANGTFNDVNSFGGACIFAGGAAFHAPAPEE